MGLQTTRERADRAHVAVEAYTDAMPGEGFHLIDLLGDLAHWRDVYGTRMDRGEYDFPEAVITALEHYYAETDAPANPVRERLLRLACDEAETGVLDDLVFAAKDALETGESADVHQALFHLVETLALPDNEDDGEAPDG
jgi:hypothetical protein